jgi:hypothetical protein
MAAHPRGATPVSGRRYLGIGGASVALGFLGLGLMILGPFGALVSACGLVTGIVGVVLAWRERGAGFWWSLGGTALSLLALVGNLGVLKYEDIARWISTTSIWLS